jgi:hypothetical protein
MVTEYALTSAQDFSNSDPGAWHLLASNDDGRSWTILDIQTNQTFKERSQRRLFSIRNRIAYNTYRLQVDTTADVALAELELIGPLAGATNEVDLQALVSASGEHTLIGPATQAFDGDPSTKWIDFGTGESKARWIQCQYTLQNEMVVSNISQFLVIARRMATRNRLLDKAPEILSKLSARASLPVRPLTGYALTSANDAPVRDPRDWKLLGSNDGGKIWRILDVRRNESFARRFQRRAFTLSKEAACALSAELNRFIGPGFKRPGCYAEADRGQASRSQSQRILPDPRVTGRKNRDGLFGLLSDHSRDSAFAAAREPPSASGRLQGRNGRPAGLWPGNHFLPGIRELASRRDHPRAPFLVDGAAHVLGCGGSCRSAPGMPGLARSAARTGATADAGVAHGN